MGGKKSPLWLELLLLYILWTIKKKQKKQQPCSPIKKQIKKQAMAREDKYGGLILMILLNIFIVQRVHDVKRHVYIILYNDVNQA